MFSDASFLVVIISHLTCFVALYGHYIINLRLCQALKSKNYKFLA